MKKLLLIITLFSVFMLVGCDRENPLEKALNEMETAESYRMDISMDGLPFFGSISLVMKVDGDLTYQSNPLGDPTYTKTIDGEEYEYILNDDDELVLSDVPVEEDDDEEESDDYLSQLDFEDFEEVDGEWVLKGDKFFLTEDETEYMTDVVIIIDEDGHLESMTFKLYTDELSSNVEMEVSDYNNTTIVVPE